LLCIPNPHVCIAIEQFRNVFLLRVLEQLNCGSNQLFRFWCAPLCYIHFSIVCICLIVSYLVFLCAFFILHDFVFNLLHSRNAIIPERNSCSMFCSCVVLVHYILICLNVILYILLQSCLLYVRDKISD
jgi:hypothetical protein